MEKVKASPVYIAVETINAGYNFERLWTRPTESEHISPGEATEVDQIDKVSIPAKGNVEGVGANR